MTISIRLDKSVEESLRRRLQTEGGSLSDFVREAIQEKLSRGLAEQPGSYEAGKQLFGRYGSGRSDRSENRKSILRTKLREKRRH